MQLATLMKAVATNERNVEMCGLAGVLSIGSRIDEARLVAMGDAIRHRGPDDWGVWRDDDSGIAMVHRRLAIIDLSPAGHQPMASRSGRFVVAFNGEIYNHLELRSELGAEGWRGRSDTETLLAGFEQWGVESTIERTVGMFALAVWDRQSRELKLVRDRIGEKPLFWGWHGSNLIFGSELKAIHALSGEFPKIDRNALASMLRYGYVPAPQTIFDGIGKLPPGTVLTVKSKGLLLGEALKPEAYWSLAKTVSEGSATRHSLDDVEAVDELESLMRRAVCQQQVADVPIGAFLSGGVDSSTIVALMQHQSSRPVRSFTIGFADAAYDEATHAKAVAAHLGTQHTELYLSSTDAPSVVPRIASVYDEPFADSSQLPTLLLAEMARKHVTVSLSGDAGDELFGGYQRYFQAPSIWKAISACPDPVLQFASHVLSRVSPKKAGVLYKALSPLLPPSMRVAHPQNKAQRLAGILRARNADAVNGGLIAVWPATDAVVLGTEHALADSGESQFSRLEAVVERFMAIDTAGYLPDDILVKVDRAAMSTGLETRVPMLDHRVVEFAWRLPLDKKIRGTTGKWILRQVLERYVPRELIERPKQGFGVPIGSWLRGELRPWAEELLDGTRLRQEGYFDVPLLRQKWQEHINGTANWEHQLWAVLMFQAWHENFRRS
jgi:asparagine synthase (glutamine-hydrolysing)